MTRETKIGLVVACSFLCLVGVVVASKWRTGDTAPGETEEQSPNRVAAVKPLQNAGETKSKENGIKNGKPAVSAALPAWTNQGESKGLPAPSFKLDPPPQGSTLTDAEARQQLERNMLENKKQPVFGSIDIPAIPFNATNPPIAGPSTNLADKGNNTPLIPVPSPGGFGAVPIAGPSPIAPFEEKKGPAIAPPSPLRPGGIDVPFAPISKDPVPNPMVPPFAPISKDPVPNPMVPPFAPISKDPAPNPVVPPFAPINQNPPPNPVVPPFAPISKDPGPNPVVPPFAPISKDPAPNPVVPPFAPLNNNSPAPSIGTAPTIPPFVVGNNNKAPLPVVRDSNLDVYECKVGDTTFAILSQRFYNNDKYAKALLAYNRSHSGAVAKSSNFSFDPPVLNPGQQVLRPSANELERDYRFFIVETSVPLIPSNPTPPPTVKLTPPSPLNPNIATVSTPPSIGAGRAYTVQSPNGESILDIAERVLGSRARWTDIYRLNQSNPSVQPQFRIPAGTQLKMPAS